MAGPASCWNDSAAVSPRLAVAEHDIADGVGSLCLDARSWSSGDPRWHTSTSEHVVAPPEACDSRATAVGVDNIRDTVGRVRLNC